MMQKVMNDFRISTKDKFEDYHQTESYGEERYLTTHNYQQKSPNILKYYSPISCTVMIFCLVWNILGSEYTKGLFTWKWETPDRWGNMRRVTPPIMYM